MTHPESNPGYVDTPEALERLCDTLASSPWLAIDTEFLRESTYYPRFCLLQIAGETALACVDPLKLDDLTPLWDLIYRPDKLKVFHAGRQDLEIFYHLHGRLPEPVFDTQLAAPLLGYPDQIGYAQLVTEILGVQLEKGHSRTDWSKRPLSSRQIRYAADDVAYLGPLFLKLRERLTQLGRLAWLTEDFQTLTDPTTYANPPEEAWRRIKGARKLKGRPLAILKRLAAWREKTAVAADRPRGWIVRDEFLIHIARLRPETPQELAQLRGIDAKFVKRHGVTLCRLVAETRSASQDEALARPLTRTVEQEVLLDLCSAVVRLQAAEQAINPAALASRKDLERFLTSPEDSKLCRGWRRQLIGEALQDFLAGKKCFQVQKGQPALEEVPP
ncbi:MAG: ribonuclease D [Methylohalobius crimeensis]